MFIVASVCTILALCELRHCLSLFKTGIKCCLLRVPVVATWLSKKQPPETVHTAPHPVVIQSPFRKSSTSIAATHHLRQERITHLQMPQIAYWKSSKNKHYAAFHLLDTAVGSDAWQGW